MIDWLLVSGSRLLKKMGAKKKVISFHPFFKKAVLPVLEFGRRQWVGFPVRNFPVLIALVIASGHSYLFGFYAVFISWFVSRVVFFGRGALLVPFYLFLGTVGYFVFRSLFSLNPFDAADGPGMYFLERQIYDAFAGHGVSWLEVFMVIVPVYFLGVDDFGIYSDCREWVRFRSRTDVPFWIVLLGGFACELLVEFDGIGGLPVLVAFTAGCFVSVFVWRALAAPVWKMLSDRLEFALHGPQERARGLLSVQREVGEIMVVPQVPEDVVKAKGAGFASGGDKGINPATGDISADDMDFGALDDFKYPIDDEFIHQVDANGQPVVPDTDVSGVAEGTHPDESDLSPGSSDGSHDEPVMPVSSSDADIPSVGDDGWGDGRFLDTGHFDGEEEIASPPPGECGSFFDQRAVSDGVGRVSVLNLTEEAGAGPFADFLVQSFGLEGGEVQEASSAVGQALLNMLDLWDVLRSGSFQEGEKLVEGLCLEICASFACLDWPDGGGEPVINEDNREMVGMGMSPLTIYSVLLLAQSSGLGCLIIENLNAGNTSDMIFGHLIAYVADRPGQSFFSDVFDFVTVGTGVRLSPEIAVIRSGLTTSEIVDDADSEALVEEIVGEGVESHGGSDLSRIDSFVRTGGDGDIAEGGYGLQSHRDDERAGVRVRGAASEDFSDSRLIPGDRPEESITVLTGGVDDFREGRFVNLDFREMVRQAVPASRERVLEGFSDFFLSRMKNKESFIGESVVEIAMECNGTIRSIESAMSNLSSVFKVSSFSFAADDHGLRRMNDAEFRSFFEILLGCVSPEFVKAPGFGAAQRKSVELKLGFLFAAGWRSRIGEVVSNLAVKAELHNLSRQEVADVRDLAGLMHLALDELFPIGEVRDGVLEVFTRHIKVFDEIVKSSGPVDVTPSGSGLGDVGLSFIISKEILTNSACRTRVEDLGRLGDIYERTDELVRSESMRRRRLQSEHVLYDVVRDSARYAVMVCDELEGLAFSLFTEAHRNEHISQKEFSEALFGCFSTSIQTIVGRGLRDREREGYEQFFQKEILDDVRKKLFAYEEEEKRQREIEASVTNDDRLDALWADSMAGGDPIEPLRRWRDLQATMDVDSIAISRRMDRFEEVLLKGGMRVLKVSSIGNGGLISNFLIPIVGMKMTWEISGYALRPVGNPWMSFDVKAFLKGNVDALEEHGVRDVKILMLDGDFAGQFVRLGLASKVNDEANSKIADLNWWYGALMFREGMFGGSGHVTMEDGGIMYRLSDWKREALGDAG